MTAEELLERYAAGERDFTGVNLSRSANLREACLIDINLSHANLIRADLRDADLTGANLTGADLSRADLTGAILIETILGGADWTGAQRKDILLCRTIMPDGGLKSARNRVMTTEELLERYAAGERKFPSIIIPRAKLRNRDLRGISLFHPKRRTDPAYSPHLPNSNLSGANLEGSFLSGTNFRGSDLSGVNFSEANLSAANFTDVNLRGANFFRADLEGAQFIRADLTGAEVTESCLYWLTFFHNTTLPNGEVIVGPIGYWD